MVRATHLIGIAALALAACDSAETLSERADASYDDARIAAAAAGVHMPERSFLDRTRAQPPAETAPWVVTVERDDMRDRDLVTACTVSTSEFKAILCVEERLGGDAAVVSIETEDVLVCDRACVVDARFGDGDVQTFRVSGQRNDFALEGRALADRVAASTVVFVEGPFDREGERQQIRFDTSNLARALAWRPLPAENSR